PLFTGVPGSHPASNLMATIGFDAFATLQQAVNVVAPGGTVNVAAGTYQKTVSIARSLTVQGSGSGTTILAAATPSVGTGLAIPGANVLLTGLSVQTFAIGLTASAPASTLRMTDLKLTGNTAGGALTGVGTVVFTGNATDETLSLAGSQFGRV